MKQAGLEVPHSGIKLSKILGPNKIFRCLRQAPSCKLEFETFETQSRHLLDILKYFIIDNLAEISKSQVRRLGVWVDEVSA